MLSPAVSNQNVHSLGHGSKLPLDLGLPLLWRCNSHRGDPLSNGLALRLGKLFFRRHVRVHSLCELEKKRALLRLTRHYYHPVFAALEHSLRRIKFQATLLLNWTVTLHTLHVEKRLHLTRPQAPSICRQCHWSTGEHE